MRLKSTRMKENTVDIIKVGVNKVNALTRELYQENKIIHDISNDNRKQNYFTICGKDTIWLRKMYSSHDQNERRQIVAMPLVETKDNCSDHHKHVSDSIDSSEIEIEIFTKYNKNVEIWTVDKRTGNKKCVVNEYLMKTPKQLGLSPNSNDKMDIIFYSEELPQQVSIHEFTWLEMMENETNCSSNDDEITDKSKHNIDLTMKCKKRNSDDIKYIKHGVQLLIMKTKMKMLCML